MKINKISCIIHKFVRVVYEKLAYEDPIFVSEDLTSKLIYLHKIKNKSIHINPMNIMYSSLFIFTLFFLSYLQIPLTLLFDKELNIIV